MDSQEEIMVKFYVLLFILIVIIIIWTLFHISGWVSDKLEFWFKKIKKKNHHE